MSSKVELLVCSCKCQLDGWLEGWGWVGLGCRFPEYVCCICFESVAVIWPQFISSFLTYLGIWLSLSLCLSEWSIREQVAIAALDMGDIDYAKVSSLFFFFLMRGLQVAYSHRSNHLLITYHVNNSSLITLHSSPYTSNSALLTLHSPPSLK